MSVLKPIIMDSERREDLLSLTCFSHKNNKVI